MVVPRVLEQGQKANLDLVTSVSRGPPLDYAAIRRQVNLDLPCRDGQHGQMITKVNTLLIQLAEI